jgi:hypothetical protein
MPKIEFRGFSEDCLVQGRLDVPDEFRLTDYLNGRDDVQLVATKLLALEDGRSVSAGDQVLDVDEIWMVLPPAADQSAKHVPTRQARVEIELGPYFVSGFLHGIVTADPVTTVYRRKAMVPITDATLTYSFAGRPVQRTVGVVIINRNRATAFRRVVYEKGKIDEMGLGPVDPRAKDMTPGIRTTSGD